MSDHRGPCVGEPCKFCQAFDEFDDMSDTQIMATLDQSTARIRDDLAALVSAALDQLVERGPSERTQIQLELEACLDSVHVIKLVPLLGYAVVLLAESCQQQTVEATA